jgi:hypothetical protein
VTSEAGARRPRSISNYGVLCQTRKTPTGTSSRVCMLNLEEVGPIMKEEE